MAERKSSPRKAAAVHPRFLYDLRHCGIRRALDVVGEKWTLLVIREAVYGVRRFDDFARALNCGRGILSARLRTLTEQGVLEAREYAEPGHRTRNEYHLTEKGRDLFTAVLALSQWSDRWMPPPDGPVAKVTLRRTGMPVVAVLASAPTVERLTMDDIELAPGPGARLISGQPTHKQPIDKMTGAPRTPRAAKRPLR